MNRPDVLLSNRDAHLSRLVNEASSDMLPGVNYALSIHGARIAQHVLRGMEQNFDMSLQRHGGVDIDLSFDPLQEAFVVDRVVIPADKKPIEAIVQRTPNLGGYLPVFETKVAFEPRFLPPFSFNNDELLELLDISQPGSVNEITYALWRAELLAKSAGWKLDEHVDIERDADPNFTLPLGPDGVTYTAPGIVSRVRISNSESYASADDDKELPANNRSQSVASIIEAKLPSDSEEDQDTLHFHRTATLESTGYSRTPIELTRSITRSNNSLTSSIMGDKPKEILLEAVPLTMGTFGDYLEIVHFAHQAMRAGRNRN
jgi:hypothetical protein